MPPARDDSHDAGRRAPVWRRHGGPRGFDGHWNWNRRRRQLFRDARPETRVWTSAIVVRHPLGEHAPHMPVAQWNHEVETLTADRADQSFAERVGLRRPHGRRENGEAHRPERAIDCLGVDAVVVVHQKSMRRLARHDHPELLRRPLGRRMRSDVPVHDPPRALCLLKTSSGDCWGHF